MKFVTDNTPPKSRKARKPKAVVPPQDDARTEVLTVLHNYADGIAAQYRAERDVEQLQAGKYGRLSDLADARTLKRLFEYLADGNYPSVAATAAGLHPYTVRRWMERGEQDPGSAFGAFCEALKTAEAAAEAAIVKRVKIAAEAGPQFWTAGMTQLERRWPDRWGKRPDSSDGPKVVVQIGVRDSDVQVNAITVQTGAGVVGGG